MKKRILSLLLAVLMVMTLMPMAALAEKSDTDIAHPVTDGNIYFNTATGEISGCDETVTAAVIPSEIEGTAVKSIGDSAFMSRMNLTSVTIPEGVSSIAAYAFGGCAALTSVTLPSTLTIIGEAAFNGCAVLSAIQLPDGLTSIGDGAFWGCAALTSITIPSGVTQIGANAFSDCRGLTKVYFMGSEDQWKELTAAADLGLGDTPVSFDAHSHEYVETVTAPTCTTEGCTTYTCSCGETKVDNYTKALGHNYVNHYCTLCSAVDSDNVLDSGTCGAEGDGSNLTWTLFKDGVLDIRGTGAMASWTDRGDGLAPWNSNKYKIEKVNIGYSVTSIGEWAFYWCTSLTSVDIPNSVTSIGSGAFDYCENLTSATIPDGVTSIGDQAFFCCENLTSIEIPSSVTSIGGSAFSGCTSLTNIEIPNSVSRIGNQTFRNCTSLTRVTIPDSVTSIDSYAFEDCTGLTSVTIPNSVTSIDQFAFSGCTGLTRIDIPNGVTYISQYTFKNCKSLTSVSIPNSVTGIGKYAFSGCTGLTAVALPDRAYIYEGAFYGCTGLTSINIPSRTWKIYDYAFQGCTSLETLTIPGNVSEIGNSAFSGCTSLKSVNLPLSLKTVGNAAFRYCSSLTDVYYEGDELAWSEISIAPYNDPLTDAELHPQEHVHTFGSGVVTAPSCTQQGFTTYTCKCGETKVDSYTDALGHNYKNGVCTRCGAYEPHTHSFTEEVTAPTCTTEGYTTYTCSCGETYTKNYVSATGHTEVIDEAVAPTCTTTGKTEGKHCSVCNEVIVAQEEVPTTDHKLVDGKCSVCGYEEGETVVPGDLTGDDKVDVTDLIRLKKYIADNTTALAGDADLNGDNKVDILDLIRLKKIIAGETSFS